MSHAVSFHPTKKLLLLPYWIVNILERNALPLSTVKDVLKMAEIASTEDLVLTLMLNEQPERVLSKTLDQLFDVMSLPNAWCVSDEACDKIRKLREVSPFHQQGLQERLYDENNLDERYPKEFDIRDLDEETFLVVIYPGHFGGVDTPRHQFKLIRTYLELWYGYSNYDCVARSPLFSEYLVRL